MAVVPGVEADGCGHPADGAAKIDPTSTYVREPRVPRSVTDVELPSGWEREQLPGGVAEDRRPSYVAFRHESGDVRVRIAPPNDDLDRTAHELTTTIFPSTDLAETWTVREVASEDRAGELAVSLMKLFNGAYDGPGTVEEATEFAIQRVSPADVVLESLVTDESE